MYVHTDGGHVTVPGSYVMRDDYPDVISKELPFQGNTGTVDLDPHVVPIVYTLIQKGYMPRVSCGGHLNTRDRTEPVQIGLELSYEEAETLAQTIQEKVKMLQYNSMIEIVALDRIAIETFPWGQMLCFFHKTDPLYDEYGLDVTLRTTYIKGHPFVDEHTDWNKEFDRRVTPEVYLEWNKTTMVMQLMVAILQL